MKKSIITTVMVLCLTLGTMAQSDGFFNDWNDGNRATNSDSPVVPNSHGTTDNQDAPVGSGILLLSALGVIYTTTKRNKNARH